VEVLAGGTEKGLIGSLGSRISEWRCESQGDNRNRAAPQGRSVGQNTAESCGTQVSISCQLETHGSGRRKEDMLMISDYLYTFIGWDEG
jgi:hypothetical protein